MESEKTTTDRARAQQAHERGLALLESGRREDALTHWLEAVRLAPDSSELHNNLGALQEELLQFSKALRSFMRAAELAPASAIPRFNCGSLLLRMGDARGAVDALRVAATLDPEHADSWSELAQALLSCGWAEQALGPLRRAIALRPELAALRLKLGDALRATARGGEALGAYGAALELDPSCAAAWHASGNTRIALGEHAAAASDLRRCLELTPDDPAADHDLGKALFELGHVESALDHFRRAAAHADAERRHAALEMIAIAIPGDPRASARDVLDARRAYAAGLVRAPQRAPRRKRTSARVVLGYLGSFFQHPNWMKPVWSLLEAHDREHFDVHVFSDAPASAVDYGWRPRANDRYHDLRGLDAQAVAARIAKSGVDVLIDLNGYSRPDRLAVLALRPAPLVVGWFNYYATSGIEGLELLIGDEEVALPEDERDYSERIARVQGSYLTFSVNYPAPAVVAPPSRTRGALTFGCLASQYKLSDALLASWGRILRAAPTSRLLLRNSALRADSDRAHLLERLSAVGIAAEHVELLGPCEHHEFLATYSRVDVTLDTFPYNGGTTTTESIWQGVPVIAFRGDRWASRTSASLLVAAGLAEFLADDCAGYERLAIELANDSHTRARLATLRESMRERLRASTVCDVAGFARSFEELVRREARLRFGA